MRRSLCFVIALVLVLSLFGCESNDNQGNTVGTIEETVSVSTEENDDAIESSQFHASEITNRGVGVVSVNETVFVADSTGVWKKTKESNTKEYITDNPSTCIATNGDTILYVYKKSDADVGDFYVRNSEIHSVKVDGTDDITLTACNESAQPFLIFNNKLYYADFAVNESFHRELFSVDLSNGVITSVAKDVTYPKLYNNIIYCSEGGFLQDTNSGTLKAYDVEKEEIVDPPIHFDDLFTYCFNDGAVIRLGDDNFEYRYDGTMILIENLNTQKYTPLYYYDKIAYCISAERYDSPIVEMVKTE